MNADDRLTSRLLAGRDRLSRTEKDAVLDGVLAAPRPRARWPWLVLPALAAAVALVVIGPWRTSQPEFATRGGTRPVAALHVSCAAACTHGAKLLFDLHGTTTYRYFAAFTKRGDGKVLWYFPTTDVAPSVDLAGLPASGVLDRGIVLGDDHPAGAYRIFGVFSRAPLTRAAIRAAFDPARLTAGADTEVVAADVEIR